MVGSGRTRGGGGKEGVGEGAVEEKAAVPLHTDAGLLIGMVPPLYVLPDGEGNPNP